MGGWALCVAPSKSTITGFWGFFLLNHFSKRNYWFCVSVLSGLVFRILGGGWACNLRLMKGGRGARSQSFTYPMSLFCCNILLSIIITNDPTSSSPSRVHIMHAPKKTKKERTMVSHMRKLWLEVDPMSQDEYFQPGFKAACVCM